MSPRVLVVDDAAFMRHMIKGILTEMGCEIVGEAADGNDACLMYEQIKPDIVTLDLIMPRMGGLDALKSIRKQDPRAKVIVISAMDQREPLMEALRQGAVDYVVKPFEKVRVRDAISRAVTS